MQLDWRLSWSSTSTFGSENHIRMKHLAAIKESHELAQTTVYDRNIRAAIRAVEESGQRDEVRVVVNEDYRRNAGHLVGVRK